MMGKKRFKRFRCWFLAIGVVVFSTAQVVAAAEPMVASTLPPFPGQLDVKLSTSRAIDGSIVIVTVSNLDATTPGASGVVASKIPTGKFEDISLPFYPIEGGKAFQSVLGVPFEHKAGVFQIQITYGGQKTEVPLTIEDGKYPSETLKVAQKMVNPHKSDLKRITREQAEIGKVYERLLEEKLWKGSFIFPIDSAITSVFGTKRVYNGERKNFHGGLDLRAPVGTPIHAPAGGEVVLAKDLYFTGNTVIINHGFGIITLYAHMSKLKVKVGERVNSGQLLGLSGKTGRVNGPHLHWQALVQHKKVNPLGLIQVLR